MELEFSRQIFEKFLYIKCKLIRPMGAELFHTDRQTDEQTLEHDEADRRYSKICEST
jgi:hypothetical protein